MKTKSYPPHEEPYSDGNDKRLPKIGVKISKYVSSNVCKGYSCVCLRIFQNIL